MELPERLAAWRAYMGWNQKQLAEKSGLSRAYISVLEGSSKPNPSTAAIAAIAGAIGVTESVFWGPVPLRPGDKPAKRAKSRARASA